MILGTKVYCSIRHQTYKDGGTKVFHVWNSKECGVNVVVEDHAINSTSKGKLFDGFPKHGGKEIPKSLVVFISEHEYKKLKKEPQRPLPTSSKQRYKAYVYLSAELNTPEGKMHPALCTKSFGEKDPILKLVKTMHEQGVISAYRMLYSPDGDEANYYNDEEVVTLKQGTKICSML